MSSKFISLIFVAEALGQVHYIIIYINGLDLYVKKTNKKENKDVIIRTYQSKYKSKFCLGINSTNAEIQKDIQSSTTNIYFTAGQKINVLGVNFEQNLTVNPNISFSILVFHFFLKHFLYIIQNYSNFIPIDIVYLSTMTTCQRPVN